MSDANDARASWDGLIRDWKTSYGEGQGGQLPAHEPVFLDSRRVDVSSSEVRARVAAGRSIHGFVPDAVAAYIAARGLYG
jgi:nicotinic acid mononucleotide adenylyltransferase